MDEQVNIMIVEDDRIIAEDIRLAVLQAGYFVSDMVASGEDALLAITAHRPDLVLMDLSMPGMNGIEALTEIKRRYPDVRVLVMTLHKSEDYIHASLKAGADGYILKDATQEEFHVAMRSVLHGKTYLSIDVSNMVVSGYLGGGKVSGASSIYESLTHREREVLKLVAEGKTNKVVADYLNLSVKTVEKHRSNLMAKLDVHNASGLTAYAIEKGLVIR